MLFNGADISRRVTMWVVYGAWDILPSNFPTTFSLWLPLLERTGAAVSEDKGNASTTPASVAVRLSFAY